MNIKEAVDFLNFFIRKQRGSFFTIEECVEAIDRGQLGYYLDIKAKYATSQHIKDILTPFKVTQNFTGSNIVSGVLSLPNDVDYDFSDLLDVQIQYQISDRTIYAPVKMMNEDERAKKLNSQIDPVTITNPIGEVLNPDANKNIRIRLYPTYGYTGTITYLKRPVKPVYAYTLISGRPIYDQNNSVQLEWRDAQVNAILLKALSYLGISLTDQEVISYSEQRNIQNYQGINNL